MKLLSVLTSLLVGVLLSGCGAPSVQHQARYPAEISGIGDSPNYPLHVAGFERGKVFTYAPGMKEISTAYNLVSPDLQIASTIYLLPLEKAASPLTAQLAREKGAIEQYHPGAELLKEEELTLVKNGAVYKVLKAAYSFEGEFMRQRQRLYSEVLLWSHKDRYIKFRSTAPVSQREAVITKNVELINALNWVF